MSKQLIVGGDSAIGRALAISLRDRGHDVLITSRRTNSPGAIYLDLTHPPQFDWIQATAIGCAFVCAGITAIAACQDDPETTRRVNVEHSRQAMEPLLDAGTTVVFLSTNLVFDGTEPDMLASAPTNSQTAYGSQKAELERWLLDHASGNGRVARLTKVLGPENPLLSNWVRNLRAGEPVTAFADMIFAPISLEFTVNALAKGTDLPPITHVSAASDISYADAARFLAQKLGADDSLVRITSAREELGPGSFIPAHTSLDAPERPDPFEALAQFLPSDA